MQCSRCGAPVQQGMTFCPNCGTPYASAQNAPIPPTQYAGPSSYEPTVAAPPPYNAGQAFSPPPNPYAPQPPASYETPGAYGTPPPPPGAFNAQSAYGSPPPPPAMYGAPYTPPPGAFMPQAPLAQPPRKKGPNVGLIIGIVVLLVVVLVGGVLALKGLNHSGSPTNTSTPGVTTTTPSSSNQRPGPSGSPIDTGAAAIITHVQTTSAIDSNYLPTNVTDQFKVGDVVYVTYHINLTQSGYVEAKVYLDGVFGTQASPLAATLGSVDHGYFNITYQKAGTGAFELYWCLQSDCSDAKLAAVATFTVS